MIVKNGLEVFIGDIWDYSLIDFPTTRFLVVDITEGGNTFCPYFIKTFDLGQNIINTMSFMQLAHSYKLVAR